MAFSAALTAPTAPYALSSGNKEQSLRTRSARWLLNPFPRTSLSCEVAQSASGHILNDGFHPSLILTTSWSGVPNGGESSRLSIRTRPMAFKLLYSRNCQKRQR